MATTNLIPWNPTGANQETDAQYLADSQRASGAVDPEFFDATLANKAFYQWSTYLTALFQAFAAKGFTTSDSNLNTLASVCANFLTTADMEPAVLNVAYATSITLDATAADGFYIQSMTGNPSVTAITGMTPGQIVAMYYQQDGVGGRTVTFPAVFVGAQQPDPAANAVSAQLFGYDSNTSQLRALTPLISSNGTWVPGLLTAQSFTLAAPGTAGQVLTNVGGVFVPSSMYLTNGTVTFPGHTYGHSEQYPYTFNLGTSYPPTSVAIVSPQVDLGVDFSYTCSIVGAVLTIRVLNSSYNSGYTLASTVFNYRILR
jgi:hypothetical protein